MKPIYLDFEYRNPSNPNLDILCCAWQVDENSEVEWLEEKDKRKDFAQLMYNYSKDHFFVAYSVEAEARCLFQLWDEFDLPYKHLLTNMDIRFLDLYLEYRMLTNHNHEIAYGNQLINGKIKRTFPPVSKYQIQTDKDKRDVARNKPEHNLAAACYKMLGELIDTDEKNKMRDLIISNKSLTSEEVLAIQNYCASDIFYLPKLHRAISNYLFSKLGSTVNDLPRLRTEAYRRGEYAARSAIMLRLGYPIDYPSLKKFSSDTDSILKTEAESVLKKHPEIETFVWNKKTEKYTQKQKPLREWVKAQNHPFWLKTEKGEPSLSLDAFDMYYGSDSSCLGGSIKKYLKTKQSLNGFLPRGANSTRKSFWDNVGNDERVRPFFGIYGSQSARSQPGSTGFLPLKAAWMRAFIAPNPGRAIVAVDYSSQEFLISGLLSEDDEMIKAYESGDPYLYFAKLDGAIPSHGTKQTHPQERDLYKTVTLGISYLMGAKSLAHRLSNVLKKTYTEEDAQELISKFYEAFPDFSYWQKETIETYRCAGRFAKIKLPCGWYMFNNNTNAKSVGNCPIQGFGSSIMRKSVGYAQDDYLNVIFTLHDALYVEYESKDIDTVIERLKSSMDKGFKFYFSDRMTKRANCRMDVFTWSPDFINKPHKTYPTSDKYIDKKSESDYKKYRKYFINS